MAPLVFDFRAAAKVVNADVSLAFETAAFGTVAVKFHERPVYEVIADEQADERRQQQQAAAAAAAIEGMALAAADGPAALMLSAANV